MFGPLVHCWSMRYESKHRDSKLYANVAFCRKNIIHSLAIKHQLKLCHFFQNQSYTDNVIDYGPTYNIPQHVMQYILSSFLNASSVQCVKWVNVSGTNYKKNCTLNIEIPEDDLPVFGKITEIIIVDQNICFFFMTYATICFNEHLHAYELQINNECVLKSYASVANKTPFLLVNKCSKLFCQPRYLI